MKKALAVLVIMMVALVAVFAASTEKGPYTITLHQTVPTQEVMMNVFYGKEEIKTVSEEIEQCIGNFPSKQIINIPFHPV